MPLINCKVELERRWTKHCVLSASSNDNANGNDYVLFLLLKAKLYVPVVTLSARDNKKLSKLLSKRTERSVYWNEFKTKQDNKNTANKFRYFI